MSYQAFGGALHRLPNKGHKSSWRASGLARHSLSIGHCQHCLARTSRRQQGQKYSRVAVAAIEDSIATDGDVDDLEEESPVAETDAGDGAAKEDSRYEDKSEYKLNFLWMDKNIGVAVDQVFAKAHLYFFLHTSLIQDMRSPVTEYYFWPRKDAWEELKLGIEAKPWIGYRDKVTMLNTTTEVINFWQTEGKRPTAAEAREKFPDCFFRGQ